MYEVEFNHDETQHVQRFRAVTDRNGTKHYMAVRSSVSSVSRAPCRVNMISLIVVEFYLVHTLSYWTLQNLCVARFTILQAELKSGALFLPSVPLTMSNSIIICHRNAMFS